MAQRNKVKRRLLDKLEPETSTGIKRNRPSIQNGASKTVATKGKDLKINPIRRILLGKMKSNKRQSVINTPKATGNNNNAIPEEIFGQNDTEKIDQTRSNTIVKNRSKSVKTKMKITLIIKTRGMKAKIALQSGNFSKEINKLNNIDLLTPLEIIAGNQVAEDDDQVLHDGVELSVQTSDDEFACEETKGSGSDGIATEPGELQSDEEVSNSPPKRVASKVVKLTPKKRLDKFSHLRNDPNFKDFLNELIDE